MNASQKEAWFNLAVVLSALVIVAALVPFLGKGALGGFGLLGFLGFGPLFFRKRHGAVLVDERDAQIRQRSLVAAYAVFWVLFVLAAMTAAAVYGWDGSVPVALVIASVWCGLIVLQAVTSLATLIQYGRCRGGRDAV
jgi:uncharacterized membrane protein